MHPERTMPCGKRAGRHYKGPESTVVLTGISAALIQGKDVCEPGSELEKVAGRVGDPQCFISVITGVPFQKRSPMPHTPPLGLMFSDPRGLLILRSSLYLQVWMPSQRLERNLPHQTAISARQPFRGCEFICLYWFVPSHRPLLTNVFSAKNKYTSTKINCKTSRDTGKTGLLLEISSYILGVVGNWASKAKANEERKLFTGINQRQERITGITRID